MLSLWHDVCKAWIVPNKSTFKRMVCGVLQGLKHNMDLCLQHGQSVCTIYLGFLVGESTAKASTPICEAWLCLSVAESVAERFLFITIRKHYFTRSYKEDKYSRRPYDPYEGVPKETQTRRDQVYNPGSTLSSRVLNCSTESLLTTSEGSAFQRLQIL